jgi:DNA-binding NtrC family response regulator
VERYAVLVVGVPDRYAAAIAQECAKAGVSAVVVDDQAPALPATQTVSLCVVGLERGSERPYETIRTLSKAVACPLVVLGEDLGLELAFRLGELNVVDLIELPCSPSEAAARALAHSVVPGEPAELPRLVGESASMRELRHRIVAAGRVDSRVLLQGETGTGKGLVARQIHALSRRRDAPFVHVDCAALSSSLIESELFGHEKGAFTGASARRQGRFEAATGGTVFLDEIGDLAPALQSKLLRVLEDRVYERVGGTRSLPLRARVIAATGHDLLRAVQEGRFRRDLYFRLDGLRLQIPPLRERISDIPLLVHALLQRLSETLAVKKPRVSDGFCERLGRYPWPGNVRELMNVLERVMVHGAGELLSESDLDSVLEDRLDLPAGEAPPESVEEADAAAGRLTGDEFDDKRAIAAALRSTGGNVLRTARRLGMSRGMLRYRIRKYGLERLIPRD